eukprot:07290_2
MHRGSVARQQAPGGGKSRSWRAFGVRSEQHGEECGEEHSHGPRSMGELRRWRTSVCGCDQQSRDMPCRYVGYRQLRLCRRMRYGSRFPAGWQQRWGKDVCVVVAALVLEHRGQALKAHSRVDVLGRQKSQAGVGLAVELDKHKIPDFKDIRVVTIHQVRSVAVSDAVVVDFCAWAARSSVSHFPEVLLCAKRKDTLGGEELEPDAAGLISGSRPFAGSPPKVAYRRSGLILTTVRSSQAHSMASTLKSPKDQFPSISKKVWWTSLPTSSRSLCFPPARMHFCELAALLSLAMSLLGSATPRKTGLNFMPAFVKSSVGSSGTTLDDGTNVCSLLLKKSTKTWRTRALFH